MSGTSTLVSEKPRTDPESESECEAKVMDSPGEEKRSLELASVNSKEYGTQNGVEEQRLRSDSEPDDLMDRDEFDTAWWAKLFPFLLKSPLLKRFSIKKKKKGYQNPR